jgi:hypothetical protein
MSIYGRFQDAGYGSYGSIAQPPKAEHVPAPHPEGLTDTPASSAVPLDEVYGLLRNPAARHAATPTS